MWAQTSRPNLGVSATAVPSAVLKKDHVNEVHSKREGSMKMNVDGDVWDKGIK